MSLARGDIVLTEHTTITLSPTTQPGTAQRHSLMSSGDVGIVVEIAAYPDERMMSWTGPLILVLTPHALGWTYERNLLKGHRERSTDRR